MGGATPDAGQHHVVGFEVTQEDRSLDAAEGARHFPDHLVDEQVKVERGGDSLCGLVDAGQLVQKTRPRHER